mmetsp:Transcript_3562/g.12800  ORF Transcript_3562/g.12800 Transcript_3562/m.12800 type:complete len:223 (-) Transcript_3562:946-1614(-)
MSQRANANTSRVRHPPDSVDTAACAIALSNCSPRRISHARARRSLSIISNLSPAVNELLDAFGPWAAESNSRMRSEISSMRSVTAPTSMSSASPDPFSASRINCSSSCNSSCKACRSWLSCATTTSTQAIEPSTSTLPSTRCLILYSLLSEGIDVSAPWPCLRINGTSCETYFTRKCRGKPGTIPAAILFSKELFPLPLRPINAYLLPGTKRTRAPRSNSWP